MGTYALSEANVKAIFEKSHYFGEYIYILTSNIL